MYQLTNFDVKDFLENYWQKKPLVIKQGLKNFCDPMDEHTLAGLTEEESVDSRIVSFQQDKWQVANGPFEDINQHCLGAWSLLVQSVDHFCPEADTLLRAFDFIPHWRMDDLMVSYSNQGGGVGPHLDQYDVFIVQGQGSRHWQVGLPGNYENCRPHPELSQIKPFEPVIDQVLEPGDIVYIPPHHPHNGVALEPCFNYSVGFRAPSQQEILSSLADYAIDHNKLNDRYTDGELAPREFSAQINEQEQHRFKQFLLQAIDSELFAQWLPSYLSQSKIFVEPEVAENCINTKEIKALINNGQRFYRAPGVKPVFIEVAEREVTDNTQNEFRFFIEGNRFSVPIKEQYLVKNFLSSQSFDAKDKKQFRESYFICHTLTRLINLGFWYLE